MTCQARSPAPRAHRRCLTSQRRSWTSASHCRAARSRARQLFRTHPSRSWIGEKSLRRNFLACAGRQGHVQATCLQLPSSEQPGQQRRVADCSARSCGEKPHRAGRRSAPYDRMGPFKVRVKENIVWNVPELLGFMSSLKEETAPLMVPPTLPHQS